MLARTAAISCGTAFMLSFPLGGQQSRPREHFQNAEVCYDWVSNSRGDKLRTFVTRPKNSGGKVPVLFFVGWLSCDSVEYAQGETDGFGALILRLIDRSGYGTVRTEKPGVGESQATPCDKSDFQGELEGYQAAFDSLGKYEFLDPHRVIVVGLSNGGGFGPLVPRRHRVRGYIAAGSWGRTWYEHMIENERVRLTTEGKSAAEVNAAIKVFSQFYDLYLIQGQTPGRFCASTPSGKIFGTTLPTDSTAARLRFTSSCRRLTSEKCGKAWMHRCS